MATKTILSQILNKFEFVLNSISEIGEVVVAPSTPIDRETTIFPVSFIFELPQDRIKRNRAERYVTQIHIETWYNAPEGKEILAVDGMQLEGLIHKAVMDYLDAGSFKPLFQGLIPGISQRAYPDDTLAAIIQIYNLEYLTVWGNPFSQEY